MFTGAIYSCSSHFKFRTEPMVMWLNPQGIKSSFYTVYLINFKYIVTNSTHTWSVWKNPPMPAAARYSASGQPSPPQPTISTEVLDKFSWPVGNPYSFLISYKGNCIWWNPASCWPCTASWGRSSCLLYLMISSLLSAVLVSRGVKDVTLWCSSCTELCFWKTSNK